MRLELSVELRQLLNTATNPLARNLLALYQPDDLAVNYLDITDSTKWSFLPKNRQGGRDTDPFANEKRQRAKVSTILNKLFPKQLKEDDVRDFIEWHKSMLDTQGFEIHLTKGEGIWDIYNIPRDKCSKYTKPGSRLYGACFQGGVPETGKALFVNNEDKIEMVYVTHEGKLDARMLIISGVDGQGEPMRFTTNLQYSHVTSQRLLKDYANANGIVYYDLTLCRWLLNNVPYKDMITSAIKPGQGLGYLDQANLRDKVITMKRGI